jgi:hypothetical protein
MVWSKWKGAVLLVSLACTGLAGAGLVYSQQAGSRPPAAEADPNLIKVQEMGKPARDCLILKTYRLPNGQLARDVKALDTGEIMTVIDGGTPPAAMSNQGILPGTWVKRVQHADELPVSGPAPVATSPSNTIVPASAGSAAAVEDYLTIQEVGKPQVKCRVLARWRTAEGYPAYQLQALDTGEFMTIVEDGPALPIAGSSAKAIGTRIFHWGRHTTPPPGVPVPPVPPVEESGLKTPTQPCPSCNRQVVIAPAPAVVPTPVSAPPQPTFGERIKEVLQNMFPARAAPQQAAPQAVAKAPEPPKAPEAPTTKLASADPPPPVDAKKQLGPGDANSPPPAVHAKYQLGPGDASPLPPAVDAKKQLGPGDANPPPPAVAKAPEPPKSQEAPKTSTIFADPALPCNAKRQWGRGDSNPPAIGKPSVDTTLAADVKPSIPQGQPKPPSASAGVSSVAAVPAPASAAEPLPSLPPPMPAALAAGGSTVPSLPPVPGSLPSSRSTTPAHTDPLASPENFAAPRTAEKAAAIKDIANPPATPDKAAAIKDIASPPATAVKAAAIKDIANPPATPDKAAAIKDIANPPATPDKAAAIKVIANPPATPDKSIASPPAVLEKTSSIKDVATPLEAGSAPATDGGGHVPLGAGSVYAAANGSDPQYVPVPIVTVPQGNPPTPPAAPPPAKLPEAPDPTWYVNAFTPPLPPEAVSQSVAMAAAQKQRAMTAPAYAGAPYGYPPMMPQQPMGYLPPTSPIPMPGRGNVPTAYQGPLPPNPTANTPGEIPMIAHSYESLPLPYPYGNPAMDRPGLPATGTMSIQQNVTTLQTSIYPSQRETAVMNLAACDWRTNPQVVQVLVTAARDDPAPLVRVACVTGLERMNVTAEPVLQTLNQLKTDSDARVRQAAAQALARVAPGAGGR